MHYSSLNLRVLKKKVKSIGNFIGEAVKSCSDDRAFVHLTEHARIRVSTLTFAVRWRSHSLTFSRNPGKRDVEAETPEDDAGMDWEALGKKKKVTV